MRKNSEGGSILTAVHESLNPVFISGGENALEISVIQTDFHGEKCRFINAYGPQEYADKEKIIAFYSRLDQEIKNAQLMNCLICIELYANAKLGFQCIPGDSHSLSSNGILLKSLVDENSLFMCNSDSKCDGLYTRERTAISGAERSIIDYLIICENMQLYFKGMKIDKVNAFAKFGKKRMESPQ